MYCKEIDDKKEVTYQFKGKILLSDEGTSFEILSEKGLIQFNYCL